MLWSTIKSALGQIFAPLTRKINNKSLSSDVVLTGDDIATSATDGTTVSSSLSNVVRVNPGYGNGLFGNNLNDWKRLGTFDTIGDNPDPVTQNVPPGTDGWGVVTVLSASDIINCPTIQLYNPLNFSKGKRPLYYRFFRDTWTEWREFVFSTPPQEFALPLAEGVTPVTSFKNTYSKDQFGIVRVWFSVHFESIPEVNAPVFTLPEGFRPDSVCCSAAILSMSEFYCATINVHPSGGAIIGHGTIGQSGAINLHGFIEFPAAS